MQYAIKDAANVTFYDRSQNNNVPVLYSDYLNTFSLSLSEETIFAKAKGSNKISFSSPKTGELKTGAEVIEEKYLAILLGSNLEKEQAVDVAERKVVVLGDDLEVDVKGAMPGTISMFTVERDKRTHIDEVSFTEMDGVATIDDGAMPGDGIVVYYLKQVPNAKKITVFSKSKAQNFRIHGTTVITNEFGEEEMMQIEVFNAKPQGNLEISLDAENVASFETTFDILSDENNRMVELTLLGVDGKGF